MNRRLTVVLVACAAAMQAPAVAPAANVSLSLNLDFNTPGDSNSGGNWTIVGKADERGLAAANMYLANINFNAGGFLAPMQFEIQMFGTVGTAINIVEGDDPLTQQTLDVGVIGGPFPSSYVDDPGLVPFMGNPNLGSFTGGVALATGTFNAGVVPAWTNQGSNVSDANVYALPNGAIPAIDANTQLTVRHIVPEPATVALLGVVGTAIVAASRRRQVG